MLPAIYFQLATSISTQLAASTDLDVLFLLMRCMQIDDPWGEAFDDAAVGQSLSELLRNPHFGVAYLVRASTKRLSPMS